MATADANALEQIGEVAGVVWNHLKQHGALSLTKLVKEIASPRDLVMQALGWLAREGKIHIEEGPRARMVSLREDPA